MGWKTWVSDYFTFTRKERVGLLTLIGLIIVIILLPNLAVNKSGSQANFTDTAWISAIERLKIKEDNPDNAKRFFTSERKEPAHQSGPNSDKSQPSTLFNFDPNTIGVEEWTKLGLGKKTITTIQNYLNKGGHFYKPEDLQRVYGLKADDYERLRPYVKIQAAPEDKRTEYPPKEKDSKHRTIIPVDINDADTSAFIALPGIGSKLAARIITFREKLGGFYSIDQLGEVYGLADSVFQKIKPHLRLENASVKKININAATVDELKMHPYIRYNIANSIVAYRNEHGPFSKIEDLKKLMVVTEEIYNKIAPYLTL